MKDLALAYHMRRMARKGLQMNPKLAESKMADGGEVEMCAHGGPARCAYGCYAEGGEVEGMGDLSSDDKSDVLSEQDAFDEENSAAEDLDNEMGPEEPEEKAMKSRLMSKILNRISMAHRGMRG